MSLTGALNIGKSALIAQQAAIQVTGNNISNAGNADYTRQTAGLSPVQGQQLRPGIFIGNGVDINSISRQIDEALQGRLRGSESDNQAASTAQQWLGRIESVFGALGEGDLASQMSAFFNSWSNLANTPQDMGLRQVVLQNGEGLASQISTLGTDLSNLQNDATGRMATAVNNADQLAGQVADLNRQISLAEGASGGTANSLRDQRDAVLGQLAGLLPIKTLQDGSITNVYVGSEPLVIGTANRGVAVRQEAVDGQLRQTVIFKANNAEMRLDGGGEIGALAAVQSDGIQGTMDQLNDLTANLIFEMNKLHASGQGLQGYNVTEASNAVEDSTVALNDPAAGLPFTPVNGSFVVHVHQKETGLETGTLVKVDLDGLNSDDTTLDSLAAALNGIGDVSATVVNGRLKIAAASSAVDLRFSQDSSGTLAALGINSFFSGSSATDIAVNSNLSDNPALLAAAKNGQPADNQTALAIASLESNPVAALDGASLKETYQGMINGLASSAAGANTRAEAAQAVQQTLQTQRQALSGVSLDEEAVNLMRQQRAFQGAARLISTVDELMKTLLSMG